MRDSDLHLYLAKAPDLDTFLDLLSLYGFSFVKLTEETKTDPKTYYFKWTNPHVSGSGFDLIFFRSLFPDDLNVGKYSSFLILSGDSNSSDEDLSMVDIMAVFLLGRYGGMLHNPQRIDKISTSFLLSGKTYNPEKSTDAEKS